MQSSLIVVAFQLLERKYLATVLRLLHVCKVQHLIFGVHFVDEEAHHLGLVDVAVVWIHLYQRLNQGLALFRKPLAIDVNEEFQEVVSVDYAFVDLLIIFL